MKKKEKKEKKGMSVSKNIAKLYIFVRYVLSIVFTLLLFYLAYGLCLKLPVHGILVDIILIIISFVSVVFGILVFIAATQLFKTAKKEIKKYKDGVKINIKELNDKSEEISNKELDELEKKYEQKKIDKKKKKDAKKNKLQK